MKNRNRFTTYAGGKYHFIIASLLFFQFGFPNQASSQDLPLKTDSIDSRTLQEKRAIQLILPDNYKAGSSNRYDVIYVLDGEWDTRKVSRIEQFAVREGFMPANIIVGIPNTYLNGINQRQRDFTPTHTDESSNSGNADKFLSFFKNELIPYINKTYPTNPSNNTVWGSSLGGLLGMYAFLTQPQLFQSYILSDPALWWDNQFIAGLASEKWDSLSGNNKTLYISGRQGSAYQGMGISDIDSILQKKAPVALRWKCMAYPDETHSSVILKTAYDGLKSTYFSYGTKPIEFHPMNGILLKDQPTGIFCTSCQNDPSVLGYTTDGTTPTFSSARVQSLITLTGPATLTVKSLGTRDEYNRTQTGNFILGEYLTAGQKPRNAKPGGWHYSYYQGEWTAFPDINKLKAAQSGIVGKDFDISKLPAGKNFVLRMDGYLEIETEGYYIFALFGDDLDEGESKQFAKLSLGNQVLLDGNYDCNKGHWSTQSYVVPLKKGFYPFQMDYFHKEGIRNLKLIYLTPGSNGPVPVPMERQYTRN